MSKKFLKSLLEPYTRIDTIAMVIMALVVLWLNVAAGLGCIALIILVNIYHGKLSKFTTVQKIEEYEQALIKENSEIAKAYADSNPLMLCIVDRQGHLYWGNDKFEAMFEDEEAFGATISLDFIDAFFEKPGKQSKITINGKTFKVTAGAVDAYDGFKKMLFWTNISGSEIIRKLYKGGRSCIAFINVDNYDDLLASSPAEEQSTITAAIDKSIRAFAQSLNASIVRIKSSRYIMVFEYHFLRKLKEAKYPIVDEIHKIETKADFPTSISVGIGVGALNLAALQAIAEEALDLALGRGGDQVVVKRYSGDTEFYGGALPTVEKRNKGKSRIVSHALIQLMHASDKVLVMGHTRPDMDCYGAAIGICCMAKGAGKTSSIVLSDVGDAIEVIHEAAVATGRYTFVTPEKAKEAITKNTLLIVVDTHIPKLTECPELLSMTDKVVVIDHHRKSKDAIENPILTYMEAYVSSSSELVTELLQYTREKVDMGRYEADALLAGITVDTKSFAVNTGVRTFEAASWLKRNGADNSTVRSFFKMRLEFYQKKVNLIASAEILSNGVAVSYTKETDPAMQVLVAQAADELLDMKGVKAAFAAGRGKNATMVSARSIEQVNVQTIMEKLGGGGHHTVAGAQVQESPEEAIQMVVHVMREMEML